MATTITSTLVQNTVVANNLGVNAAFAVYNFAATGITVSTSLCIQMVPLPHGARVLDLWVRNDSFGTGAFAVGDSSTTARFVTADTSLAASLLKRLNVPAGVGYKISLTESDKNSFDTIDITLNGLPTVSASGCIAMCVYYLMD